MADADELQQDAERERELSDEHLETADMKERQAGEQRDAEERADESHEG